MSYSHFSAFSLDINKSMLMISSQGHSLVILSIEISDDEYLRALFTDIFWLAILWSFNHDQNHLTNASTSSINGSTFREKIGKRQTLQEVESVDFVVIKTTLHPSRTHITEIVAQLFASKYKKILNIAVPVHTYISNQHNEYESSCEGQLFVFILCSWCEIYLSR